MPVESVTIRDQLAVVGRRWRIIASLVVIALIGGAVYYGHKHSNPKYVSHAQVQVNAVSEDPLSPARTPATTSVVMPTEIKTAMSQAVALLALKNVPHTTTWQGALSHLKVTSPTGTQDLDFAYTASHPSDAQAGARAFVNAYLANRKTSNEAIIAPERATLTSLVARLTKQAANIKGEQAHASAHEYALLQSHYNSVNLQLSQAANRLAAVQTVNPIAATINTRPTLPSSPTATSGVIIFGAALVLGLALGLIAAFVIDSLDDHIHGPADLAALTGAPVLSRIPVVRSFPPWRTHDLAAEGTSHPKVAEAYRLLANRLIVEAAQESLSSIMVASPSKGEGRSSVAANLAATFVDLGCRVWLVSADLMPPQMHKLFSPDSEPDVLSVVPFEATSSASRVVELAIRADESADPGHGHLTLMTSSAVERRQAGRLLNPLLLAHQIRQSAEYVDLTIIDAPALLEYADAVPLLPVVDGVVVVADAGATRRSELKELADMLEGTRARTVGSVLNRDGSRVVSRRARRARQRINAQRGSKQPPTRAAARPPAEPQATATTTTVAGAAASSTPAPAETPAAAAPDVATPGAVDEDLGWPAAGASAPEGLSGDELVGWG